ncbi:MAG: hypothetical protein LBT90_03195 [Holosporaceae bacterium]|nr:hypothetical protein [Holosporaceae bacterium]
MVNDVNTYPMAVSNIMQGLQLNNQQLFQQMYNQPQSQQPLIPSQLPLDLQQQQQQPFGFGQFVGGAQQQQQPQPYYSPYYYQPPMHYQPPMYYQYQPQSQQPQPSRRRHLLPQLPSQQQQRSQQPQQPQQQQQQRSQQPPQQQQQPQSQQRTLLSERAKRFRATNITHRRFHDEVSNGLRASIEHYAEFTFPGEKEAAGFLVSKSSIQELLATILKSIDSGSITAADLDVSRILNEVRLGMESARQILAESVALIRYGGPNFGGTRVNVEGIWDELEDLGISRENGENDLNYLDCSCSTLIRAIESIYKQLPPVFGVECLLFAISYCSEMSALRQLYLIKKLSFSSILDLWSRDRLMQLKEDTREDPLYKKHLILEEIKALSFVEQLKAMEEADEAGNEFSANNVIEKIGDFCFANNTSIRELSEKHMRHLTTDLTNKQKDIFLLCCFCNLVDLEAIAKNFGLIEFLKSSGTSENELGFVAYLLDDENTLLTPDSDNVLLKTYLFSRRKVFQIYENPDDDGNIPEIDEIEMTAQMFGITDEQLNLLRNTVTRYNRFIKRLQKYVSKLVRSPIMAAEERKGKTSFLDLIDESNGIMSPGLCGVMNNKNQTLFPNAAVSGDFQIHTLTAGQVPLFPHLWGHYFMYNDASSYSNKVEILYIINLMNALISPTGDNSTANTLQWALDNNGDNNQLLEMNPSDYTMSCHTGSNKDGVALYSDAILPRLFGCIERPINDSKAELVQDISSFINNVVLNNGNRELYGILESTMDPDEFYSPNKVERIREMLTKLIENINNDQEGHYGLLRDPNAFACLVALFHKKLINLRSSADEAYHELAISLTKLAGMLIQSGAHCPNMRTTIVPTILESLIQVDKLHGIEQVTFAELMPLVLHSCLHSILRDTLNFYNEDGAQTFEYITYYAYAISRLEKNGLFGMQQPLEEDLHIYASNKLLRNYLSTKKPEFFNSLPLGIKDYLNQRVTTPAQYEEMIVEIVTHAVTIDTMVNQITKSYLFDVLVIVFEREEEFVVNRNSHNWRQQIVLRMLAKIGLIEEKND